MAELGILGILEGIEYFSKLVEEQEAEKKRLEKNIEKAKHAVAVREAKYADVMFMLGYHTGQLHTLKKIIWYVEAEYEREGKKKKKHKKRKKHKRKKEGKKKMEGKKKKKIMCSNSDLIGQAVPEEVLLKISWLDQLSPVRKFE